MGITREDIDNGDQEFAAAFAEDMPDKPEVSEDEAFGLTPEGEDGGSAGGEGEGGEAPAVAIVIDPSPEDHALAEEPAEAAPTPGETEAAAQTEDAPHGEQPAATDDEPADPKEIQRQKSWEGRLRAREAELKAREDALKAREASTNPPADEAGEGGESLAAEAVEQVAEQVESGQITPEQAMKALAEDFGEEFSRMLSVLIDARAAETAGKVADEKVGQVDRAVQELVSGITDDKARSHFEAIADAHPDFMEVADSQLMKDYLAALPEDERSRAEKVVEGGSAKQIIKLLSDVKASAPKEAPVDEPAEEAAPQLDPEQAEALEAAEGVRSSGLKLPEKPRQSNDYESSWDEF